MSREGRAPKRENQAMDIAEQLVAHLSLVVPSEVTLSVFGDGVRIDVDGAGSTFVTPWPGESPESFARNFLANLQEEIFEEAARGLAWPSPEAYDVTWTLPEPNTEVVQRTLVCWYGSRDSPALLLPPILLDAE
jgi:hypothetical protein